MPKYILTDKDKEEILLQSDRFTAKQLAEQYGCSRSTILKLWIDNNYHKPRSFSYYVNDNYFSEIDTVDKAYIVGLIASDGNIYKREGHQGQLRFSFQNGESEYNLLKNILIYMQATCPINESILVRNNKEYSYISIVIVSDQIFNDLSMLGIIPRKIWEMDINKIMSNIPKQFIKDFLRGYVDGDGSIINSKNNPNKPSSIDVRIAMPLNNAQKLQSYLSLLNINTILIEDKRKYFQQFCNLCFFGKNKYIFLKWIYYDNCLCLQRKYDRAVYYCYLVENNVTNRIENIKAVEDYQNFTKQNDWRKNNDQPEEN